MEAEGDERVVSSNYCKYVSSNKILTRDDGCPVLSEMVKDPDYDQVNVFQDIAVSLDKKRIEFWLSARFKDALKIEHLKMANLDREAIWFQCSGPTQSIILCKPWKFCHIDNANPEDAGCVYNFTDRLYTCD